MASGVAYLSLITAFQLQSCRTEHAFLTIKDDLVRLEDVGADLVYELEENFLATGFVLDFGPFAAFLL